MNIGILGSGAIGKYLAISLVRAGIPTTLIPVHRDHAYVNLLNRNGITLQSDTQVVTSTVPLGSLNQGSPIPDLLILSTKAYQNEDIAQKIIHSELRSCPILVFQNGWDTGRIVQAILPHIPILLGVVKLGVTQLDPCTIRLNGVGTSQLAPYSNSIPAGLLDRVVACLSQATIPCEKIANWREPAFIKVVINSVINPLTALYEKPNGMLLETPSEFPRIKALIKEAAQVGKALGIDISEAILFDQVMDTARTTENNYSSMLQDIQAGRPTEWEYLNGALIRVAHFEGMTLPTHEALGHALKRKVSAD
jgi:2-dehydropantoate 2-reductase